MIICGTIIDIKSRLNPLLFDGKIIGFVPTMGALHEGHLSLLKSAQKLCDVTICSIFVNPNQFTDPADFERYPRDYERDCKLLENIGCNFAFIPQTSEIYPEKDERIFDFGTLDKILEGNFRKGHFNGVAQIVSKLFSIMEPHFAFFGAKDLQQTKIVEALVTNHNFSTKIIVCPTLREEDGLAMSSRNALLNSEERKAAALIPAATKAAQMMANQKVILPHILSRIREILQSNPLLNIDYIEFCKPENLEIAPQSIPGYPLQLMLAVYAGKIRLIDNAEIHFPNE